MTTLLDRLQEHLVKKRQGLSDVHETLKKITGRDTFDDHLNHGKFNKRLQIGIDQKQQLKEPIKKDVKRLRENDKPYRIDNQNRKVFINSNDTSKSFKNGNNSGRISAKDRLGTVVTDEDQNPVKEEYDDDEMDDDPIPKKTLQSQVMLSSKIMKSRTEVLAAQQGDQVTKERNRRMFGSLLGTLQKFKKEETQLKDKEEKKAKIERRLEEEALKEKESLVIRKRELFMQRKQQQRDIKNIEIKMGLVRNFEIFERQINCTMNFIKTEFDPSVFYLPKIHNEKTEKKLEKTRTYLSNILGKKRNMVESQIEKLLQPDDEQMEYDDREEDGDVKVADEEEDADVDVYERHQDNGNFNYD
ncbi:Pinin/SDK/MemA protein [Cinara cedri]|uniref:Pinin/SDK/MemA protein n=1 Tax=Cinara cedri TaxID=506608 RepID=A0A5E4NA59_9HEMI|nr:Pinin/SDK/MemA protein [Cinara cedri]